MSIAWCVKPGGTKLTLGGMLYTLDYWGSLDKISSTGYLQQPNQRWHITKARQHFLRNKIVPHSKYIKWVEFTHEALARKLAMSKLSDKETTIRARFEAITQD